MRIIESSFEKIGPRLYRQITILEEEIDAPLVPESGIKSPNAIGSGPAAASAVPDRIVQALIQAPDYSLTLSEIQNLVGGNHGTVNRQAWTLATNAPDLQIRLRGWVFTPERGRYSLTPEAIKVIKGKQVAQPS